MLYCPLFYSMKRFSHNFLRRAAAFGAFIGIAATIYAGDISAYRLAKGQLFSQTSASAPVVLASNPASFFATVEGNLPEISSATFMAGFGGAELSELNGRLEFFDANSSAVINQTYPNGTYTLYIDTGDGEFAMENLNTPTFPTAIPHVSNFAATQTIDPAASFTVNFDPFTGQGANDYFEFEVTDDSGSGVFLQKGNGPAAVIPAGTLQSGSTYNAQLRFFHELSQDTASIAGAIGSTAAYNETQFSMKTTGSTGGTTGGTTAGTTGGTGTGPTLSFSFPQNGATGVTNSTIIFQFSTGMANTHSIQWSANVNASTLIYSWPQNTTLIVTAPTGFPANSTVTWTLNPVAGAASNFRDTAGHELATTQGSFSTGAGSTGGGTGGGTGGTTSGCQTPPTETGKGYGVVMKMLDFVQTGNTAPVPDTESPASFVVSYGPATNQNVTKVVLTSPSSISKTLENPFGSIFFLNEEYNSAATLDAAEPAGTYTLAATGAGTASISVGSSSAAVIPRFLNLVELTTADFTKPFTLQFSPFTGASGQFDSISINISDTAGGEFFAPDYCNNVLLPNTATTVVIPAGKLHTGSKLRGSITFYKSSGVNSNAIPNTFISSAVSADTKFDFTTVTPPNPNPPRWTSQFIRNADGTITFNLQCDVGLTLAIEGASALGGWTQLATVSAVSGTAQYKVDPKASKLQFLRARVL